MLYKLRWKSLLNHYFCKGWKIKTNAFWSLLNTYIFTKYMHLVLYESVTEFCLGWSPLTENPYKNIIEVGSGQLCGQVRSTAREPWRHTFLKCSWKSTASTSNVLGDVQTQPSLASLGQWGVCRDVTSDFSTLLPREFFPILAFTSVKENRVASASLRWRVHFWKPQDLEELPFILSVPPFGRTCRKQQPGSARVLYTPWP